MDRNAYIWLLLVIYRRHDKRDKRDNVARPSTLTNRSAYIFTTLCRVTCLCDPPENSVIDEHYRKKSIYSLNASMKSNVKSRITRKRTMSIFHFPLFLRSPVSSICLTSFPSLRESTMFVDEGTTLLRRHT